MPGIAAVGLHLDNRGFRGKTSLISPTDIGDLEDKTERMMAFQFDISSD